MSGPHDRSSEEPPPGSVGVEIRHLAPIRSVLVRIERESAAAAGTNGRHFGSYPSRAGNYLAGSGLCRNHVAWSFLHAGGVPCNPAESLVAP